MLPYSLITTIIPSLLLSSLARGVTVYTTFSTAAPTSTLACFGANACDAVVPPTVPPPGAGAQTETVNIQLMTGGMAGLGNPVKSDFMGFSIELSIVNQISMSFAFPI